MKLKALVVGIALAVTAPAAMAEGFYGAFDLGQSKVKDFCVGVTTCSNTDTAYRFSAGYQVNQNFGVEGSYVDSGSLSGSGAGLTVNSKNTEWQVAATGTLPVGNGFSLIGKAGIAFWDLTTSATLGGVTVAVPGGSPNGNDFLWGIGAQYDISKTIAVRGQYDSHKIGDNVIGRDRLTTLSVGVVYKF